jgi:adenylate cyclase
MGDGVMLVFGVPAPDEDHCLHAITCALVIQTLVDRENRHRERDGLFPVRFRMGLNTGTMLAGNMGSRQRMEYTVVGDTVNMASRLCNIAQSGQIVVSDALYKTPGIGEKDVASEHQSIRLRGIRNPVTTYLVEDLNAACGAVIEEQIAAILRTESQISQ